MTIKHNPPCLIPEKLIEEDRTLHCLADYATIGLLKFSNSGQPLYVNSSALELLGVTKDDFLNNSWLRHLDEEQAHSLRDSFNQAISSGLSLQSEVNFFHPTLGYIWVSFDFKPLQDSENPSSPIDGYVCQLTNITDQHRLEEAQQQLILRMQAQQDTLLELLTLEVIANGEVEKAAHIVTRALAATIETDLISVWIFTDNDSTLRCFDFLDRNRGEHTSGLSFNVSDFPNYLEALTINHTIDASDVQTDPRTVELLAIYLDPHHILSLLDCAIVVRGKVVGVVSCESTSAQRKWEPDEINFCTSIANTIATALINAERRETQQALADSDRRFRLLAHAAPVGIFETNAKGSITYLSQRAVEILGTNLEELRHKGWTSAVNEASRDQVHRNWSIALSSHLQFNDECHINHPELGERIVVVQANPKLDHNAVLLGYIGTLSDITEAKLLEMQFLQSQKMESIGRLAGGIAHDFNNILTAILGYEEMAAFSIPPNHSLQSSLTNIREAVERAAALTRQLLAFSRQQLLQMANYDVNSIILSLSRMWQRLLGEDVNLELHLSPDPAYVYADCSQIEQVLMNLAVNARDAMPQGGRLIIETSCLDFDQSYTESRWGLPAGQYVLITVVDTGVGMTEEVRSRIFEPFFTTKEVGKGTGLGLATVYGIVKQHNGAIDVYSKVDRGTVFKIVLPAGTSATQANSSGSRIPVMPGGKETILLVEDEPAVLSLIEDVLNQLGYRMLVASNGLEALSLSEKFTGNIDLLLTDVIMPGMSGKELSELIRANRPKTKVMFISGYTADYIARQGGVPNDIHLLQKPILPETLAIEVRALLDIGSET